MEENNTLIPVAMKIIMSAGNARTKVNQALDVLGEKKFGEAKQYMNEARENITIAHQVQTQIIQGEAAGNQFDSCMLFAHAQDTLMSIMSEVNIAEKLIVLFESFSK